MNRISKAVLTALVFTSLALGGCGGGEKASGEKTLVYATTGYGREMGDAGLDPHENYSGWSTAPVRTPRVRPATAWASCCRSATSSSPRWPRS